MPLLLLLTVATYAQTSLQDKRDGKTYKTVQIGRQTWMAENLNYNAEGSVCYDNKPENCEKYGRLYNWETAMKSCPQGWRLPSSVDWDNLVAVAGGYNIAGKNLKSKNWPASVFDYFYKGTDNFGFSALPAIYRSDLNKEGFWWTATEETVETKSEHPNDRSCARTYYIQSGYDSVNETCFSKDSDFSVRCVKGSEEEAIAVQKARTSAIEAEIAKKSITFTDARDGKKYRSIKIGKQTWMAENLNYKADSSWCYGNDESNCAQYGRLYNWETAMKACPKGWHLPTHKEWEILLKPLHSKMLKSKSGWKDNGNGTDELGFSAMPGGKRYYDDDSFSSIGEIGNWWTSTGYGYDAGDAHSLKWWYFGSPEIEKGSDKMWGFSVRCLQN